MTARHATHGVCSLRNRYGLLFREGLEGESESANVCVLKFHEREQERESARARERERESKRESKREREREREKI